MYVQCILYRYKMASSKQDSYLLVAAIDFGTTYSGYAFSTRHDFLRDPTNTFLKQWVDPTSSMMYNKTSTCILFHKDKKFNKFGFEAEAKYMDLILDKEQKDWFFFRRFKMSLYEIQVIISFKYRNVYILNCFHDKMPHILKAYYIFLLVNRQRSIS